MGLGRAFITPGYLQYDAVNRQTCHKTDKGKLMLIPSLKPPYFAVIFSSIGTDIDDGYQQTAQAMQALATQQTGFLGLESVRDNREGITISYWQDLESIHRWKQQAEHLQAQQQGRDKWYTAYQVRICKVERSYGFDALENYKE